MIDTSPDLKNQLIKNKIKNIHKVFYTHYHADQTHGINELRLFFLKNRGPIDIYTDLSTEKYLKNLLITVSQNKWIPSNLKINKLKNMHSYKDANTSVNLKCFKVKHGNIDSICYIINKKLAYASDISDIYKKDLRHFQNLQNI